MKYRSTIAGSMHSSLIVTLETNPTYHLHIVTLETQSHSLAHLPPQSKAERIIGYSSWYAISRNSVLEVHLLLVSPYPIKPMALEITSITDWPYSICIDFKVWGWSKLVFQKKKISHSIPAKIFPISLSHPWHRCWGIWSGPGVLQCS